MPDLEEDLSLDADNLLSAVYLLTVQTPQTSGDGFLNICSIGSQTSSDFRLCLPKTQVQGDLCQALGKMGGWMSWLGRRKTRGK